MTPKWITDLQKCITRNGVWFCVREYMWTLFGGLVIGSAIASYLTYNPPDPVELIQAQIVETCREHDGTIIKECMSSERMKIAYHVKWTEVCPMFVDIFIFKDAIENEIVYRNGPFRAAFEEGDQKWVREVFIPPNLKDGKYIYRARLTGRCKNRDYTIAVPDMPFIIKRSQPP